MQCLPSDIAGNFEPDDGERPLRMLFEMEDTLMETDELPSDFPYIVARRRADRVGMPLIDSPENLL